MCNIKIHETQPLLNLKLDRVMQDIVYKLVPGLQESEYCTPIKGCLTINTLLGENMCLVSSCNLMYYKKLFICF